MLLFRIKNKRHLHISNQEERVHHKYHKILLHLLQAFLCNCMEYDRLDLLIVILLEQEPVYSTMFEKLLNC